MNEPSKVRPHHWALMGLGIGAFLAGATALVVALVVIGLLLAPLAVWLAWNVLDFASAIGAPELGFWGIVLLTLFLMTGFGGRLLIALIVWIVDPQWLAGSETLHWPQWSLETFFALVILLLVAHVPARARHADGKKHRHGESHEKAFGPTVGPAQPR
jgi:hypothetical protein